MSGYYIQYLSETADSGVRRVRRRWRGRLGVTRAVLARDGEGRDARGARESHRKLEQFRAARELRAGPPLRWSARSAAHGCGGTLGTMPATAALGPARGRRMRLVACVRVNTGKMTGFFYRAAESEHSAEV